MEKGGLVRVHDNEDIVPAKLNRSANVGGGSITIDRIEISLNSAGSAQTDADELARQILPALRRHMGRSLTA